MSSSQRLLAVLQAVFVLGALGCGDEEGGCGPAPEKAEEPQQGAGGSSRSAGGSSGAAELITQDKKGRVPEAYQRKRSQEETAKSSATISAPVIPLSPAARRARALPIATIIKRRVDGVVDRVEIKCRILSASPDGNCSGSANYDEIKERCCPGGLVERCKATSTGIVLVGRGCEPGLKQE